MKSLFLILGILLLAKMALCQTKYKSYVKEKATWNYFEKKYDVPKRYEEVTEIVLDWSTILFRNDAITLTIIREDKTVLGNDYDLDSWIVWGDFPSDILKFTIAKYKTSNDIVFTIVAQQGLIRWYAKQ